MVVVGSVGRCLLHVTEHDYMITINFCYVVTVYHRWL